MQEVCRNGKQRLGTEAMVDGYHAYKSFWKLFSALAEEVMDALGILISI